VKVHFRVLATALSCGSLILPLAACGSSGSGSGDTIKVAYQRNLDNKVRVMDDYLAVVKKQFEKANPGKKVELVPIQASENDYYSKVQLMMRSPRTAPDLVYEDTFLINSDIASGYLRPIDSYLSTWKDWNQFLPTAKAAAKAQDGKTYGVPDGTDTRGLWYNKELFQKAGLPTDWHPKSWDDLLSTARTLKQKLPGVTPINIYTGKAAGEAASMQGFEMLLYGTGQDPLYDPSSKKWVVNSKGFTDALGFLDTVFKEKLGPDVQDALGANFGTTVGTELIPQSKLAIDLDGSWMGNNWIKTGGKPWPQWSQVMAQAPMPTQNGQAPGTVSLSGGWTWAIPAKSKNPDLAWKFITTLQSKQNAVDYDVRAANIAVRQDVASDPTYLGSMPGISFFTGLVKYTHYRPALPAYPQVSTAIQDAMESVTIGQASPAKAASQYASDVKDATDGAVVDRSAG
jgi:multiple sugar transport system substrate-binding protein